METRKKNKIYPGKGIQKFYVVTKLSWLFFIPILLTNCNDDDKNEVVIEPSLTEEQSADETKLISSISSLQEGIQVFEYDTNNKLTSIIRSDENDLTFLYNADGTLSEIPPTAIQYTYDNQRRINTLQELRGGPYHYTYTFQYGTENTVEKIQISVEDLINEYSVTWETFFSYDSQNRITRLESDESYKNIYEFTYDASGNIVFTRRLQFSGNDLVKITETELTYDDNINPYSVLSDEIFDKMTHWIGLPVFRDNATVTILGPMVYFAPNNLLEKKVTISENGNPTTTSISKFSYQYDEDKYPVEKEEITTTTAEDGTVTLFNNTSTYTYIKI